jgi:hypothetical protein
LVDPAAFFVFATPLGYTLFRALQFEYFFEAADAVDAGEPVMAAVMMSALVMAKSFFI